MSITSLFNHEILLLACFKNQQWKPMWNSIWIQRDILRAHKDRSAACVHVGSTNASFSNNQILWFPRIFFFFSLNAYAHSDGAAAATRHLYTTDVEQFMGVRFCFRSVPVVVLRACVSTYYKFVIRPAKPKKKINVFWFECSVVEGQWTGWMKVKLGKVVLLDAEIQASGSMWYLIG